MSNTEFGEEDLPETHVVDDGADPFDPDTQVPETDEAVEDGPDPAEVDDDGANEPVPADEGEDDPDSAEDAPDPENARG